MKNTLNNLLDTLQLLDEKKIIITASEFQEEKENLDDLVCANDALKKLIKELALYDKRNLQKVVEEMVLIRMKIIDIMWHYEQLYNITTKFIQRY